MTDKDEIKLSLVELNELLMAIGEEPEAVEMEVGLTKNLTPKGWDNLAANAY